MLLAVAGSAQSSGETQDSGQTKTHSSKSKEKPYALLAGTVWTADGHPMPGVKVFIRRANEKKTRWMTLSNGHGEIWQRVPAGTQDYVVSAEVKQGKDKQRVETTVHVDNDERVDFGLHLKQ